MYPKGFLRGERIESRSVNSSSRQRSNGSSDATFQNLNPRIKARFCTVPHTQVFTSRLAISRLLRATGYMNSYFFFANLTFLIITTMGILQTQRTLVGHHPIHQSSKSRFFFSFLVLRSTKDTHKRSKLLMLASSLPEESSTFLWSYSTLPGFSSSVPSHTQMTEQQKHETRSTSQQNTASNHIYHVGSYSGIKQKHFSSSCSKQTFLEKIFAFDLPEGQCVGVRLATPTLSQSSPHTPSIFHHNFSPLLQLLHTTLHPEEIEYGLALPSDSARHSFFIGRLAIRSGIQLTTALNKNLLSNYRVHPSWINAQSVSAASPQSSRSPFSLSTTTTTLRDHVSILQQVWNQVQLPLVGHSDPSILKDVYGRPQIPHGFLGSISHKGSAGVALVTMSNASSSLHKQHCDRNIRKSVGVDIERTFSRRSSIAKKVLTPYEMKDLGKLENVTKEEEVLLRFSLKECVYKAMHPLISQRVGFQEAEVTPHDDGTATVMLNLKSRAHERFAEVKAHWRRIDLPIYHSISSEPELSTTSWKDQHQSHLLGGDDESGEENQYFLTSSSVTLKHEYNIILNE